MAPGKGLNVVDAITPGLAVMLVDQSPPESGGVPSRSEGGAVCSKTRSNLIDFREALIMNRCASRISERTLQDFEQTAPASLREDSPRLLRRGLWRLIARSVSILDCCGHRPRLQWLVCEFCNTPYVLYQTVALIALAMGTLAVTVVPLPGADRICNTPPAFFIRSDMPDRPRPDVAAEPITKPHPLSWIDS